LHDLKRILSKWGFMKRSLNFISLVFAFGATALLVCNTNAFATWVYNESSDWYDNKDSTENLKRIHIFGLSPIKMFRVILHVKWEHIDNVVSKLKKLGFDIREDLSSGVINRKLLYDLDPNTIPSVVADIDMNQSSRIKELIAEFNGDEPIKPTQMLDSMMVSVDNELERINKELAQHLEMVNKAFGRKRLDERNPADAAQGVSAASAFRVTSPSSQDEKDDDAEEDSSPSSAASTQCHDQEVSTNTGTSIVNMGLAMYNLFKRFLNR